MKGKLGKRKREVNAKRWKRKEGEVRGREGNMKRWKIKEGEVRGELRKRKTKGKAKRSEGG